ncbi:hypothetical protein [Hoyosella subflava]|uniref:hypothetical protein n=1 Tax=Hoyosella subflava TaxID=639313 RepID=UPI00059BB7BD|nr:hypothetical protein [Hoyosella subflava]
MRRQYKHRAGPEQEIRKHSIFLEFLCDADVIGSIELCDDEGDDAGDENGDENGDETGDETAA